MVSAGLVYASCVFSLAHPLHVPAVLGDSV